MLEITNLPIKRGDVPLRVARGHFATTNSHINYYIDITYQKTRLNEARAVAKQLVTHYKGNTMVDTILCLDGTMVIGTCLAMELTNGGLRNMNGDQSINVLEPEYSANNQMIFRDNIQPMIREKRVLVLVASVTTGFTVNRSMEAISYYGGDVVGVASLYSAVDQVGGYPVRSIYNINDLPDYESYDYRECPYCKKGRRIDALINSFGYSGL